jgi:tRNA U34 5-carboxymethylaminomethyl modifying enzyme MnmG/GidA
MLAGAFPSELGHISEDEVLSARLDIEGHYDVMVSQQQEDVMDVRRSEALQLPADIPYHK